MYLFPSINCFINVQKYEVGHLNYVYKLTGSVTELGNIQVQGSYPAGPRTPHQLLQVPQRGLQRPRHRGFRPMSIALALFRVGKSDDAILDKEKGPSRV